MQTEMGEYAGALPLGRRSPRGRLRWYLVACPEGQEAATCERVRQIIPSELLIDAFVPRKERQRKVHGAWETDVVDMFSGYFIVATKDAPALSRALAKLSFPVQMVGAVGRGYQPIAEDAQHLLTEAMDASHVVRLSWGEVESDVLHVQRGPLLGKEGRVSKFIRRKSVALVRVGENDGGAAMLNMPLAIVARR